MKTSQKCTKPALKALDLTFEELARRVPPLPVSRLQELLNGKKPTSYEIQLLKNHLGREFNPTSTIREKILNPPIDKEGMDTEARVTQTLRRVNQMQERLEAFETELLQRIFHLDIIQAEILQKVDRLLKLNEPTENSHTS